jgi:hypothetical protein
VVLFDACDFPLRKDHGQKWTSQIMQRIRAVFHKVILGTGQHAHDIAFRLALSLFETMLKKGEV